MDRSRTLVQAERLRPEPPAGPKGTRHRSALIPRSGRWGPELRGCAAVADRDLVVPTASRLARGQVETCHVRLKVDDRRPVQKIDASEPDALTRHLQKPDQAQADRVDPPWRPGGEHAHRALLASQQKRNLPKRRFAAWFGQLVQPAHQPGVVKL